MAWESDSDTHGDRGALTHIVLPTMDRALCGRRWMRLGPRWGSPDRDSRPVQCPECREAMEQLIHSTFGHGRQVPRQPT